MPSIPTSLTKESGFQNDFVHPSISDRGEAMFE